MIASNITAAQLSRLQVLYKQYEAHTLDVGATRENRLAWASQRTGRTISSFSGLTLEEGKRLIDILQGILGVKLPAKSKRRVQTQRDGEKAGTEGRHDQIHAEATLVSDRDIRRIQREMDRLGWHQGRLEAFLASSSGPNGRRTSILTLGDANRVYWALKRMSPPRAGQPGHTSPQPQEGAIHGQA